MNKWMIPITAISIGALSLTSCMPAGTMPPDYDNINLVQLEEPQEGAEIATVETTMGDFSFVLYPEQAPNTVANFKQLVADGFYTNNVVYSVEQDVNIFFAGAEDATGTTGKVATEDGKTIKAEVCENLWHFTGAVSAYGVEQGLFGGALHSDSRFFALGYTEPETSVVEQLEEYSYPEKVISAYKELGGQPLYTGRYTVFGHIYDGMETVESILDVAIQEVEGSEVHNIPVDEILIEKITLSTYHAE